MTESLMQSATELANTLAEENRALGSLELARAVTLLDAKLRATSAFIAAQAREASNPDELRTRRQLIQDAAVRLRDLAADNKRLLEHAIRVQGRVIGSIVEALPKVTSGVQRYGASGAMAASRVRPIALAARV